MTSKGVLMGVGLTMVIVVIGINLMFMLTQIKASSKKKEIMDRVSHIERNAQGDVVSPDDLPIKSR
ncbi:hypothetical protein L0665_02440 [Methanogenium marinum]|uniref:Uncharacterized protein n=1 Tax=Methanogenium marinum TaxID=348610 RepID=A0A9Q4KT36_9EURY|nr:hypothetical protein [Methanogenium marinum]MDE4907477.1 hypothetical protein [Methanogenium marinum]